MLIEHYVTGNLPRKSTYLQVVLSNNEAIRYEIEDTKLIKLIGKQI